MEFDVLIILLQEVQKMYMPRNSMKIFRFGIQLGVDSDPHGRFCT